MLIDIGFKENDVVSMKLTSGEEIIGMLVEDKDSQLILSKPMSLTATQQGMGLAPFMFTVDPEAKFAISKSCVTCVSKTQQEMASNYIQNTTGLTA